MKRRWHAVLGWALLLGILTLITGFGVEILADPAFSAQLTFLSIGGVAFVIGGRGHEPFGLDPIRVIGIGDCSIAAALLVNAAVTLFVTEGNPTIGALVGVSALGLAFIGIDYARGGVYFDADAVKEGPLLPEPEDDEDEDETEPEDDETEAQRENEAERKDDGGSEGG